MCNHVGVFYPPLPLPYVSVTSRTKICTQRCYIYIYIYVCMYICVCIKIIYILYSYLVMTMLLKI